jgi:DNA modification methylase
MSVFFQGDSLSLIKKNIPSSSVNLIYIDPPFGTTNNSWDESLNWKEYFHEFFRILKDDGMLVIHCSIPFNYELIRSAPKSPSYSWYWLKDSQTSPLLANKQPLRQLEEILVWKNKKNTYYRQQIGNEERRSTYMTTDHYYGTTSKKTSTIIKGKTRTHFIHLARERDGFSTRPKELIKLMIDSYSKEGDTVLDCFCYKGLSSTQCKNRRWIGMDKYFFPILMIK